MSASSRGAESRAYCQNLLMRFRVLELKELLRSIGQSTKGRKPELMQRSTDLLRHGSAKIQDKIHEIWEKSHAHKKPDNYHKMAQRYTPMKGAGHVPMQHKQFYRHDSHYKTHRGQYVIHPDVNFKENPFYVKIDTIIRPTALVSTNITAMGSYSMRLEFHLTPHQVQKVYTSRTAQGEYNTQVVMRFCLHEISCEQEDFLPKGCAVRINGQYLSLPSHTHSRPDHLRRTNPLDITHYIKTTPTDTNDITIVWQNDVLHPQGFVTTIELSDTLSYSDLLNKLKSKGIKGADHTRALVKDKLSVDKDSEISATSLKVSLICPLGKLRITNPCRAKNCKHLQCFDASIYLQMNERKARWVCPVCDKPAPFDDLEIDGLFKEICEKSPHNDIEFASDGNWYPFSNRPGSSHLLSSPDKKPARYSPVMINDTIDDVERDGVGGEVGRGKREESGPVVIDLTLSSSDEEDEAPPRTRTVRRQSSSSSTTSASSSEERDDSIATITLDTSGCISPLRSSSRHSRDTSGCVSLRPSPPTRAVARGGSASSNSNSTTGSDGVIMIPNYPEQDTSTLLKDWMAFRPLLLPTDLNTSDSPIRLNADSANPALQLMTLLPQSSHTGTSTSLLTTTSKPLSSSTSSLGQAIPVITSCASLPVTSFPPLQPSSSDLNSDPFLPDFDDNLLQQLSTSRKL